MPPPTSAQPLPRIAPLLALAAARLREGRLDEAIGVLQEAGRLQPSNAIIHHDLGLALLETGQAAQAVRAFQQAVANNGRYTDAYFRMGIALEKLGDLAGAVLAYDRATALLPSLSEAWFRAGSLLYTMGHREEAIGCFKRAAATGRKNQFGRLGAARALLIEGRDSEAETLLRQAIASDPRNALALDLLGNILTEAGRFEEAHQCFTRAVTIAPLMGGTWYDLVRCRTVTAADNGLIAQMEAALVAPQLEPAQRLAVHLALGKAADDLEDYARAMRHFDDADAERRALASFDPEAFDAEIGRIIACFTPERLARAADEGAASAAPVLILGMPRSGTTLVEQIVSSHPDVVAGGELNYWNERGAAWRQAGGVEAPAPFLARAAADYLQVLHEIGPKAARVTDKMPFNFLWVGLIHLALPHATIIHCRRAAIDTALSIHQTLFHQGLAFPTGGPELVAYFRSYRRLTDHWRRALPPDCFLEVDYEDLTHAPEPAIRRIIERCGLPWDDACLRPEKNRRSVKTPSKWQTRQPIYRRSVSRWRRYEPWLGPLRALLDDPIRPDVAEPLPAPDQHIVGQTAEPGVAAD